MAKTQPNRSPESRLARLRSELLDAQVARSRAIALAVERADDIEAQAQALDEVAGLDQLIAEIDRSIATTERTLQDIAAATSTAGRRAALDADRQRLQRLRENQARRLKLAAQIQAAVEALAAPLAEFSALANEASNTTSALLRGVRSDIGPIVSAGTAAALLGELVAHGVCRTGITALGIQTTPAMTLDPPVGGGTPPETLLTAMSGAFDRVAARIEAVLDAQAAQLDGRQANSTETPAEEAAA